MKNLLYSISISLLLVSCAEKEQIISNELCHITYHEEFKKLAVDLKQEEQLNQEITYEKKQNKYLILNNGERVSFELPFNGKDKLDVYGALSSASYYQKNYFSKKEVTYKFHDESGKIMLEVKTDKLPTYIEQTNFSLYVDQGISKSDLKKLKQLENDNSLPQESTFWLRIEKSGDYGLYIAFNDATYDKFIFDNAFKNLGDVISKLKNLGLSKKIRRGFMNLDFQITEEAF